MRILILGGFGFLGKNINNIFYENTNFEIHNESRRTSCDLFSLESIEQKIKQINPSIIINCSAHVGNLNYVYKNSSKIINDNILMMLNLYKAVSNVNNKIIIINPISNCSYPYNSSIQKESQWWDGELHQSVFSYGSSKKAGYSISKCYEIECSIKTLNLIIPNAYGPYDYLDVERSHAMNGIITRMIQSIKNKEKEFYIWGSGTPIREWIFMPDLAKIIYKIINEKLFDLPNPINIGQKKGISINEIAELIKEELKCNLILKNDTSKPDGDAVKILDDNLFKKFFNNFEFTEYKYGIRETINYYMENL